MKRREFLTGAAAAAALPLWSCSQLQPPREATMILRNGRIVTMDSRNSIVSSIAIMDGRILAVGGEADTQAYQGPGTRTIDLGGRTVVPGLNDSHLHLITGGLQYNLEVRWDNVPSLADALRMLREQARRTPPPQWVRVLGGWSEFQFAERRMPTLEEVNAVSLDTPVLIMHYYDTALLNRAAVRALGYNKNTPQPQGGEIVRDPRGDPTGIILAKPSMYAVLETVRLAPQLNHEDRLNSMRQFMRELNRLGITSVGDGGTQVYPGDYRLMEELARNRHMSVRVACSLFSFKPGREMEDFGDWVKSVKLTDDPLYRIQGAGEILTFSAFDSANFSLPRPDLRPTAEADFAKVIRLLAEHRWPFRFHATYNESITRLLGVLDQVNREVPFNGLRWFIDHAETITPRNIERVRALGGGIAIQNRLAFQGEAFLNRYGAKTAESAPPVAEMLKAGVPVGAGTDATRVSSFNPWISLYWLVTGRTVGGTQMFSRANRLDRMEALRRYTVGSAWFSGDEKVKGSLEPGKFADLAVLSADYFAVPEQEIKRLESLLTIMDGKIVHAKGPYASVMPPALPASPSWSPVNFAQSAVAHGDHGHASEHWIQSETGLWTMDCNCMVA